MAEATAGVLQIVKTQQNLVGNTITGGASAISEQSSNSQVGILEQIRTITLQSFRKTSEIAATLANTLLFQKDESRRREDQSSELELEQKSETRGSVNEVIESDTPSSDQPKKIISGFFGFLKSLGSILVPSFLLKLLAPLSAVFGKNGFLFKFLGRAGPLAAIGAAIFLITRYSNDIVKALSPVIEKIKKLFEENAPLFEALKNGFDFLFKNIIGGIGRVIGGIIDDISPLLQGIGELFKGNFLNAFKLIGEGLLNVILFVPRTIARFFEPVLIKVENYIKSIPEKIMNGIKSIGTSIANFFTVTIPNTIKNFINGIIDSLPLPDFVKNKLKINTSSGETATSTTQELPKTINVDQPRGTSKKEASVEDLVERRNKLLMQGPSGTSPTAQQAFEGELKMRNASIIEAKNRPKEHSQKNIIDPSLYAQLDMQNKLNDLFPDFYEQPTFKFGTAPSGTGTVTENKEFISPDDQMNQFDKSIPKRNLKEDNRVESSMSVVNAPVNSSSVVNNSQPTISFTKMDTGVDAYTEKMQNSI